MKAKSHRLLRKAMNTATTEGQGFAVLGGLAAAILLWAFALAALL